MLASAPRPVSVPSRSWMSACLGPSQSIATQRVGTIHERCGGGRYARLVRETPSMEMSEKKMGGTSSDDCCPPGSLTPSPFMSGCSTRDLPQLDAASKSWKVTPITRVSAARAGAEPVGDW